MAGFKFLELHFGHGYLAHTFYSPLWNQRTDEYGGSFQDRIRFVVETVRRVRGNWPGNFPLSVRLSLQDWVEGGWTLDESVDLCKLLKTEGTDLMIVVRVMVARRQVSTGAGMASTPRGSDTQPSRHRDSCCR